MNLVNKTGENIGLSFSSIVGIRYRLLGLQNCRKLSLYRKTRLTDVEVHVLTITLPLFVINALETGEINVCYRNTFST